jgi:hypothetical protein
VFVASLASSGPSLRLGARARSECVPSGDEVLG